LGLPLAASLHRFVSALSGGQEVLVPILLPIHVRRARHLAEQPAVRLCVGELPPAQVALRVLHLAAAQRARR
jgi:hypothetical protein